MLLLENKNYVYRCGCVEFACFYSNQKNVAWRFRFFYRMDPSWRKLMLFPNRGKIVTQALAMMWRKFLSRTGWNGGKQQEL